MQQEDETKGEGGVSANGESRHSYDDEDEMIDMEMDEYPSDDEHDGPH